MYQCVFGEVVEKLPVHQPSLTVRVLAFCKTSFTNECQLVHAPRQKSQAMMSCENVILVSMQDYMDRITLIALMTGTVLVEIAIDGQPPLDHLPKEKIHAKTFVGYKTIKSA